MTVTYLLEEKTMKEIVWDDDLKIHVSEIDIKRRRFIDHLNLVITANNEKAHGVKVFELLSETAEFAFNSFRMEEKYMRRYDHPDFFFHFSEHTAFMQDLLAFLKRYKTEDNIALTEPLDAIRIWLIHHTKAFDRKLKRSAADSSDKHHDGIGQVSNMTV